MRHQFPRAKQLAQLIERALLLKNFNTIQEFIQAITLAWQEHAKEFRIQGPALALSDKNSLVRNWQWKIVEQKHNLKQMILGELFSVFQKLGLIGRGQHQILVLEEIVEKLRKGISLPPYQRPKDLLSLLSSEGDLQLQFS